MAAERSHFASIELLRGAAALAVAIWHLTWVDRGLGAFAPAPAWLGFGYAGVDLFFALSGFVISHVTDARRFRAWDYAARRWIRIVPLYAFFTGLALLAVLLNPAWDGSGVRGLDHALRSLLIAPMWESPVLGVGWSLEHELIFYAIAGAALASGRVRALPCALAALFAAGVVWHFALYDRLATRWFDYHLFSLYHFEFLVGVLAYRARERLARLGCVLPLSLGAVGFSFVSQLLSGGQPGPFLSTQPEGGLGLVRVLGYGSASGLLIAGLLAAERRGRLAPRRAVARNALRLLAAIGSASYVLYLSHWFVYSILAKLYAALGVPAVLAPAARATALACAVGFALGFHRIVERPLLRALRQRLAAWSVPIRVTGAAASR